MGQSLVGVPLPSFLGVAISTSGQACQLHQPLLCVLVLVLHVCASGQAGRAQKRELFLLCFLPRKAGFHPKEVELKRLSFPFSYSIMFPGRFLEKDASGGGGDRKETFLLDASGLEVSYSQCRCFLDRLPHDSSRLPDLRVPRFLSERITVL